MNTNLIEVIDNIQMESDNAVLESMFEYYNKAFMIMESCDEEVLDNFNIIQKGFGDDVSKDEWDTRSWDNRKGIRYNLVMLCRELVKEF